MRLLLLVSAILAVGCPTNRPGGGDYYLDDDDDFAPDDDDTITGDDDDTACDPDTHEPCAWNEFCYAEQCQGVLGRRFVVTALSADVGTTTPSGANWDFGGGAPDLYASFGFDGEMVTTNTVSDSFSADWNQWGAFVFTSGDTFLFNVWDDDIGTDDFAVGWLWEGDDALVALARQWGLTLSYSPSDDGRILVRFEVVPDF
jgi:hypothetical protein